MSAFKGTPGPWEVVNAVNVFTRLGAPRADGVEAAANDGWHIADMGDSPCFVDGDEVGLSHEERKANARLIAASPELLGQHEADMVDLDLLAKAIHAGDPMPELVIRVTDMLNRKRAAIAKATGEQS